MSRSPDRRLSRLAMVAGLVVTTTVAIAARSPQSLSPSAQPPVPTAASPSVPADSGQNAPTDTLSADDALSAQGVPMMDGSAELGGLAQFPAPAASWPVDPVTGQTIINGEPVVGRVFILQKVDGLRKYESVKSHYVGEALPPQPPVIGSSYAVPALGNTRRMRGTMVQATLWSIDNKPSAVANHYYRPSTSGTSLGQQY